MLLQEILEQIKDKPHLQEAMEALHLTESTFHLLPIFPLIYVAWSDGKLQEEEVDKILEVAKENGLLEEDGAGVLSFWLNAEERPDDAFFVAGLRLVAEILKHTHIDYKGNLLLLCESVAEAADWFGRSTSDEKKALSEVARLLGIEEEAGYEAFLRRVEQELQGEELTWLPMSVEPRWILINGLVSVMISGSIYTVLWRWYPSFVVTEHHMSVFVVLGLLLPPVGFFVGSMITARLSPGDTSQEGVIGTAFAVALSLVLGFAFVGNASKKFAGYNVSVPDPILYPGCKGLKSKSQRCILEQQREGERICRVMPNAQAVPSQVSIGRLGVNWFKGASCERHGSLFYVNGQPPRLKSRGYYPLCKNTRDPNTTCIRRKWDRKTSRKICHLVKNKHTAVGKGGKQFKDWFPAPLYCHAVFTRVYALWKKQEHQQSFVGYMPACGDLHVTNQSCIHLSSAMTQGKLSSVCMVSDSPKILASEITPAKTPYKNWYPLAMCQELHGTAPLVVMFSVLGFALFAFLASWTGGLVGERWQGTI